MDDNNFPVFEGAKGGGSSSRTPVEAPDSLNSIATARILDLLGEGEQAGWLSDDPLKDVFLDETPVMNEDGTLNFTNVVLDWRDGTQDQSYIQGFPSVENEVAIGVELKQSAPWTRAISNLQLSAINIRISVQSLSKTNNTNGDKNGYTVRYAIDIAADGGAFDEVLGNAFTGKTNDKYERGHRLDLPAATSGWVVRVRRLTADTEDTYIQDTTAIESITEIIDVKLRYPHSALAALVLDAAQFRSIPSRAFRRLGRLMQIPSNYNPVTREYTGMWDGTFQIGWNKNPAWVFFDIVTQNRFGLGQFVDQQNIDKWALYKIAQYCDELVPDGRGGMEPRFTCTVFIQRQEEAYKVIQDLASVFRGISYWGAGSIIPVSDMPRDYDSIPVYTNANVKGGKFSYQSSARRARHTVALVSWSDYSDFNRQKVEYVEDPEGIARYGIQETAVVAVGADTQSQAQRVGKWILLTEKLETDTVSFVAGLDQILALPGGVVRVADRKRAGRRVGGRVAASSPDVINVDLMPTVAPGDDLFCMMPNGKAEKRTVVTTFENSILVDPPFSDTPVEQAVFSVESPTLKNAFFTVISVSEGDGLEAVITAIQHEPAKFDAVDNGVAIEPRITTDVISAVQRPPTNVLITAKPRAGQVMANMVVNANWTAAAGAVEYDVQWRREDGEWSPPQRVLGTSTELYNAFAGAYACKVSARNGIGIQSVPAISETYVVADQTLTPGFVDELNADILEALTTAENAAAIADGAVVSFWQTSPPVIGSGAGQASDGDIWFDTNDGNRIYRVVAGTWVDAQDDQLALAIAAATLAQATADGKVATFFQSTAPTAVSLGDLWFNTTTKKLFRWNGFNWNSEIADVTLDQLGGNGINLLPDQYSTYEQTSLPPLSALLGTVARDAVVTPAILGSAVLKLTNTSADASVTLGTSYNIPHTAGKKYIVSAYFGTDAQPRNVQAYAQMSDGTLIDLGVVAKTAAGAMRNSRLSWVADLSARTEASFRLRFYNLGAAATYLQIDGVMVEEQIGRLPNPSAYSRGAVSSLAIAAIAAASAAQDTADGKIDSFFQPSPPTIGSGTNEGKLGDLWFDSDDGNKQYRCNGSAWVLSQDTAIGDAILAAAGAQSTADGKVTTFYTLSTTPPTATALGDVWYVTDTATLKRWNGAAWQTVGDDSSTTQAANLLVVNGGFEAGATGWTLESGWSVGSSSPYLGSNSLARSGVGVSSNAYGSTPFSVTAGESIVAECMLRSSGANGEATIHIQWLSLAGAQIALTSATYSSATSNLANNWKKVIVAGEAPSLVASARVVVNVSAAHTAGTWYVDQTRAFRSERTFGPSSNMLPNSNFGGVDGTLAPWGVTWNPAAAVLTLKNRKTGLTAGAPYTIGGNVGALELYEAGTGTGSPTVMDIGLVSPVTPFPRIFIPVTEGKRYEFHYLMNAHRCSVSGIVGWFDAAGAYISETANAYSGPDNIAGANAEALYVQRGMFADAPSGATQASVWFRKGVTSSGANSYVFLIKPYFGEASATQTKFSTWSASPQFGLDEMSNGYEYGTVANTDLSVSSGVRRLGVRVPGSGHRLGDQRNLMQSITTAYGSVRSATALSATPTTISVNAHAVRYGSFTVNYSAVSPAISGGLTAGVKYVVYCFDPDYTGGSKTWYIGTTPDDVMQLGDGIVIAGEMLIPASGTSTGGGGSNDPGDGGDWCVDVNSNTPCGRCAGEIEAGDVIQCWNDDAEFPEVEPVEVESNEIAADQLCYRLTTVGGASVVASASTPMTLRDGTITYVPDMLGDDALILREDGSLEWEMVSECKPVGMKKVAKIKVHQRCYFAGAKPGAYFATHNPIQKP